MLVWVVALPAMAAASADAPHTMLDVLGAGIAITGLAIEALADFQLARFLSRREAQGAVLDTGLWRYSRHPNYFFEWLHWVGWAIVALASIDLSAAVEHASRYVAYIKRADAELADLFAAIITRKGGAVENVPVRCRIDTPIEIDYYQHGGILPYVLRQIVAKN